MRVVRIGLMCVMARAALPVGMTMVAWLGAVAPATAGSPPDEGRPFEPAPLPERLYGIAPPNTDPARQRHVVTAADGARIWTETWLPAAKDGNVPPERVPTVLLYSPYLAQGDPGSPGHQRLMEAIVTRGYAYSTAHVRGTGASGGCIGQGWQHEADDGARVVEYLGRDAPWASGSVGMYGISYPGGTQVNVAARGDPEMTRYLKAIVPVAPATNWYDGYYQDGVPWLIYGPASTMSYFLLDSLVEDPGSGGGVEEYAQKPGCQPGVLLGTSDTSGDFTPFWRERDARLGVANIRAATLLAQGHLDDRVPSFSQAGFFDRLPPSTPRAALFGTWNHEFPDRFTFSDDSGPAGWERADWLDMVVAWYDRYLLGLDTGVEDWPVAQVQGTDGQWRAEPEWPGPGGEPGQLALGPGGALGATQPTGSTSYLESMVETTVTDYPRGTGAVFETPPLARRLELHGTPVLDAWVTLDRADSHLAAKLEALGPDGNPTIRLSRAVGLRSARHLDPLVDGRFVQERGRPAPVGPPVRVPLRFNHTSLVVPPGGRLRLTVAASVIVNDGLNGIEQGLGAVIEGPSQPSGAATRVTLLHDCDHPSALRFELPSGADLLNVREPDEPADQPLADNRPYEPPVADGGMASDPVCGESPVAPGALLSGG